MNRKICFCIGHRDAPEALLPALTAEAERLVAQCGAVEFVVGNYGKFDRLAARAIAEIKERHADVALTMLLPYPPGARPVALPEGFDGTLLPEDAEHAPRRYAIVRANRWMVDHSDFLIAYAWRTASNAKNLLEYARRRERAGRMKIALLARPDAPPAPGTGREDHS